MKLCAALKQRGKERIQDLVKNPLRLSLLCFNWQSGGGKLPQTKAELYEQYVDDFYRWKQEQFPTTLCERENLNLALGELSKEAIGLEKSSFRLKQDFVSRFLGQPEDSGALFSLSLKLGWINKIGVDIERQRESVYAFFHPTFEEYFAASSIRSWNFFFNDIPEDPLCHEASYRAFEPQWLEVMALWLGKRDISNTEKQNFINQLAGYRFKPGH